MSGQRGFTLIESIVTLVILATFASGLLTWLNGSVISYQKLAGMQERQAVFNNALDVMIGVNPMKQPVGQIELAPYVIEWQADQKQLRPALKSYGTGTYYDVGLYKTTVSVNRGATQLGTFSFSQVGYKQTRFPGY